MAMGYVQATHLCNAIFTAKQMVPDVFPSPRTAGARLYRSWMCLNIRVKWDVSCCVLPCPVSLGEEGGVTEVGTTLVIYTSIVLENVPRGSLCSVWRGCGTGRGQKSYGSVYVCTLNVLQLENYAQIVGVCGTIYIHGPYSYIVVCISPSRIWYWRIHKLKKPENIEKHGSDQSESNAIRSNIHSKQPKIRT